jgi:hypothetical protein
MLRIFDPESSDLLSLTAVPCVGEIPYIEDFEPKRTFVAALFDGKLDLILLQPVLPRRQVRHTW